MEPSGRHSYNFIKGTASCALSGVLLSIKYPVLPDLVLIVKQSREISTKLSKSNFRLPIDAIAYFLM